MHRADDPLNADPPRAIARSASAGPLAVLLRPEWTLAMLSAIAGVCICLWRMRVGPYDFEMFWYAGRHLADPYASNLIHTAEARRVLGASVDKFRIPLYYPPPFLLLMAPLSVLPLPVAYCLWSSGSLALFAGLAARRLGWAAGLALLGMPAIYNTLLGQTGLFIACCLLAVFMLEDRPKLAGALFAVITLIKPQSALVAPFLLWGRWEHVKGGVIAGLGLIAASLALGPHLWVQWLAAVQRFPTEILPLAPKITPGDLFPGYGWRILLAIVGVGFALWERGVAGFLVGTLFLTPYVQIYDLAVFSVFGAQLLARWKRAGPALSFFGVNLVGLPAYSWLLLIDSLVVITLRIVPRFRDLLAPSGAVVT
jgi:hypothetical protein